MNAVNTTSKKKEPRNMGVTVVSGAFALVSAAAAVAMFMNLQDQWIYGIVFGVVALACLAVAIYGRKSLFVALVESFPWLP